MLSPIMFSAMLCDEGVSH